MRRVCLKMPNGPLAGSNIRGAVARPDRAASSADVTPAIRTKATPFAVMDSLGNPAGNVNTGSSESALEIVQPPPPARLVLAKRRTTVRRKGAPRIAARASLQDSAQPMSESELDEGGNVNV